MSQIQNIVPFKTGALFCQNCGMMLKLTQNCGSTVTCKFCQHKSDINSLIGIENEVVHKKEFK